MPTLRWGHHDDVRTLTRAEAVTYAEVAHALCEIPQTRQLRVVVDLRALLDGAAAASATHRDCRFRLIQCHCFQIPVRLQEPICVGSSQP